MRPRLIATLLLLGALMTCLTSACLTLGPRAERETVWASHGTVGKVVSDTTADVLVLVDGRLKRTKADIKGMIVIDEPTYLAMLKAYKDASD